jgi:hypothetical protein
VELERLKLKAEAKREKGKARLELAQLKMKQEHEFRLVEMRMTHAGLSSTSAYASSSRGPFDLPVLPAPSSDLDASSAGGSQYNTNFLSTHFKSSFDMHGYQ